MRSGASKPAIAGLIISATLFALGLVFIAWLLTPVRAKPSRGRFIPLREEEAAEEEQTDKTKLAAERAAAARAEEQKSRVVREQLTALKGNGNDEVCIYIYMNGSDLESVYGFGSQDLREIMDAGTNPKLHILVQTMGTRKWQDFGIASDHSQRYEIKNHKLILLDDELPQLDCTAPETLSDFLVWGHRLYPSNRNILVLWDHGGGSVDGFGYDEWQDEDASLTLDEMQQALWESGMTFDFIGMDACIMSSIEVCYALYDYCDYCILSEDFESALGWSYGGWISTLASNTSVDTETLARGLIDDMIDVTNRDYSLASSTLSLIDERYVPQAFEAWMEFAYENEEALLSVNYSREVARSGRAHPRVSNTMAEYYITDILALAVSIDSHLTKSLVSRLASCVVYYNCSQDNTGLTGLSVTLPYGDNAFYHSLGEVFGSIGIDKQYIRWLARFQTEAAADSYYDYYEFDHEWDGWEDYELE